MEIDKKIIADIKKIYLRLLEMSSKLRKNKFNIIKWFLIIFVLFILYKTYKIITYRKIVKKPIFVNSYIYIKKQGSYKVGLYLNIKENYLSGRHIIANVFYNPNRNKIIYLSSLGAALNSQNAAVNLNPDVLPKFNSALYRYRHLKFASRITNFKKNDKPFFLFYLDFDGLHKLERILYTPIKIPKPFLVRTHIILANIGNNENIKPEININKFIYFYPKFKVSGAVKDVKAMLTYKYKGKMFLSKSVYLHSGKPVNIYKILKNKNNKGNDLKLTKINISYGVSKNKKGNVKLVSLELIEPNISFVGKVFENFIFRTYFKNFMQKSIIFKNELKKSIYEGEKNDIPAETVKKKFVSSTINRIFILDYTTKIKHISNIHSKIVRAFYRFVYQNYTRRESFMGHIAALFRHKKTFYKNLLIPIESPSVKMIKDNKTVHFTINFKKLKLYKYFTRNKKVLSDIMNGERGSFDKLTLRGSNDDYWHGKYYYRTYPLLSRIKAFIFITSSGKPEKIKSYFYFNSIPEAYPKFLAINDKTVGHYDSILIIIGKYNNSGPYKFLKGPKLNYLMKTKLLHIENLDFSTNDFLLLRQFIDDKQEFNKIFKNGGGWIYKRMYLKKGKYYINALKSRLFKIKMITLKKIK